MMTQLEAKNAKTFQSPSPPPSDSKSSITTKLTILLDSMRNNEATTDMNPTSFRRAPTRPASAGSAHVYYRSGDEKFYLGTVSNKDKLVFFSRTASDQLLKADFNSNTMKYVNKVRGITVSNVDDTAGRIVFNWINTNDIHNPRPLTLAHLPKNYQLLDGCKLHHASNAFHLERDLRGDAIRASIFMYLRNLRKVTLEDFQMVLEWLYFDAGLVMEMKRKIAYQTIKGLLPDDERGRLMNWCVESDQTEGTTLVQQMVGAEAQVQAQMKASAARREQQAALAEQQMVDNLVVVHESAYGEAKTASKGKAAGPSSSSAPKIINNAPAPVHVAHVQPKTTYANIVRR